MKKFLSLFTALLLLGSMTVVQATTWTPAGTPTSVFTNEWTPNTPANDMTLLSNSVYAFTKSVSFSSETEVKFKVCKDHGWTPAYPGSDYSLNVPSGDHTLLITYKDDASHSVMAYYAMTVAGEPASLFGETWNTELAANDMTLQNDGTYKFEKSGVALTGGSKVKFKACANHGWDNAWPSSDYELSIPESGNYTITITFNPATLSVSASADLEEAVVVIPNIQLHSNIQNPSWASTANFAIAGNNETASLTLTGVTKGNYEFGVKIDGTWTSNGSAFSRANPSHAVVAGSDNCTFNADRNGDYTFTWTYATNTLAVTYPAIPAQSVTFNSLASQILKGSVINLANCVTSSGIDDPTYRFYIKEKNGSYGDAINANYNFDANGEYVVKVEALEYGEPVAYDESAVVVYQSYTFTNGSTIYVDFSAVSGDVKGVNYPKAYEVGMDWDGAGAGTIKAITFTTNVTWTTMEESFIKTEKNEWAAQPFTVPGTGKNCVVVAADGASYTWSTYTPIKLHGNFTGDWGTTDAFAIASNKETASLTLTNIAVGNYEFGVRIGSDDNWTSNSSAFNRENPSHAITADEGNCTFNADRNGDYTFTWTYATSTLEIGYPAEPDAFVAGSATEIFGAYWDGSAEANKMTWDGELGKFTKTYTVDKAYKSVSLKVVYDNQWYGVNGGEDNVKFSLSGAGTFTVLFDKTNHHVDLLGEIVGDEQFDFAYAAVAANGEGNWAHGEDWNAATTTNRMTEVSANVWEISFDNVPAKDCQFKFCFDGTWDHEFGGTFAAFGAEGAAVYGNTSSSIDFTSIEGSEITIRLDLSAFNFATKEGATFTVSQVEPAPTFVTVREDLTAGWYYTMCLNKAVTAVQGASIWRVVSKAANGSDIILEEVEGTLDAGRPYIFYATATTLQVMYTGAAVDAPVITDNNGLVGSFEKTSIAKADNNYIIYNNMLYLVDSDNVKVGANRAYLHMGDVPDYSGAASAPGRRRVTMTVYNEQTTTDIDVLNASEAPVKMIIDGQLFIIRGEKMYDATGRLVK